MTDDDLPPLIPTPSGLYRHYKGALYEVLATCLLYTSDAADE